MKRSTRDETERRYRRLLAQQQRSGLSMRMFAKGRGIPSGTLSYWKHQLKKRDAERAREQADSQPTFLPVKVLPLEAPPRERAGYELVVGQSCVLRLPRDFEVARIAALLKEVAGC